MEKARPPPPASPHHPHRPPSCPAGGRRAGPGAGAMRREPDNPSPGWHAGRTGRRPCGRSPIERSTDYHDIGGHQGGLVVEVGGRNPEKWLSHPGRTFRPVAPLWPPLPTIGKPGAVFSLPTRTLAAASRFWDFLAPVVGTLLDDRLVMGI